MFKPRSAKVLLSVLARYGMLSTRSLRTMSGLRNHKSGLARMLQRLREAGLIERRTVNAANGMPHIYLIAQTPRAKEAVSRILGVSPQSLDLKPLRYSHLEHEDQCGQLQFALDYALPGTSILRDWQFMASPYMRELIPFEEVTARLLPDLVVAPPAVNEGLGNWLAVELDVQRKSDYRYTEKLLRYAAEARFAGLLYLMPEESLLKKLRQIFTEEVEHDAPLLMSRSEFFMALGVIPKDFRNILSLPVICGGRSIRLGDWMHFIRGTPQSQQASAWTRLAQHGRDRWIEDTK